MLFMAYGDFPFSSFIVSEEHTTPEEVDGSVFQQVQSPGSIVQNLPFNSPRHHTPRVSGSCLTGSSSHTSSLFPTPSSVTRGEEFRLPSLPSEGISRRLSRRQTPPITRPPNVRPPPEEAELYPAGRSTTDRGELYTPSRSTSQEVKSAKDILSNAMAGVWFERNADKAYALLKKEQMATRMKELRKQLDYLEEFEWYYMPVDELIGQY